MKVLRSAILLSSSLACISAHASNALSELEKRKGDVAILYDRQISDFEALHHLRSAHETNSDLNIIVTTNSKSPRAEEYQAAVAYAKQLKVFFPQTQFTIGYDNMMSANYIFIVEASSNSIEYDSNKTLYSSRSTGVKCTSSINNSIECKESSSSRTPIGTEVVKNTGRSIDLDIRLRKANFYGKDNPKTNSKGQTIFWDTSEVATDHLVLGFVNPQNCSNKAAAVATAATKLALNPMSETPQDLMYWSSEKILGCNIKLD